MDRGEVLDEAKRLTYGDRNVSYDEPRINHKRIGVILGIVLERYVETAEPGDAVPPEVAALCMAAMKLARLSAMPTHLDSAIDLAAYAAICAELASYVEPFGNVVIESQACGTPTITTDWGAFTENNPDGISGFRCRTLQEFMDAAESVKHLDRAEIRKRAVELYKLDTIGLLYEDYFERLLTLWGDGWYEMVGK